MKRIAYFSGIILIFILLLRLPLVSIPFFNWDEAEAALYAGLLLNGGVAYRDVAFQEAPVREYIFALIFKFFGRNNMLAIHSALIFLIFFISIVLYFISTLIGDGKIYYWVALFFGLFSHTYTTPDMFAFQTEWIAIFFGTIGAYLFLRYIFKDKYFFLLLSGISFGLSFFSRQTAILDYLAALLSCGLYVFVSKRNMTALLKAASLMIAGFFLVFASFVCYFYFNNALKDFWFYFWEYNSKYYVAAISAFERINSAVELLLSSDSFLNVNFLLPLFFVVGTVMAVLRFFYNSRKIDRELLIDFYLISWAVFSYIGTALSGRNFGHYFIMTLPAFCLVSGRTIQSLFNSLHFNDEALKKSNIRIFIITVVIFGMALPLVRYHDRMGTCKIYFNRKLKIHEFPEDLLMLAEYIKKNCPENEKIFVWGFYPQIYILSNRASASRYIVCNFLTGLVAWANVAPGIDTSSTIVPGSWEIFMDEITRAFPLYIVDTSPGGHFGYVKYPLNKFQRLFVFLKTNYMLEKEFFKENGDISFRLFRRID